MAKFEDKLIKTMNNEMETVEKRNIKIDKFRNADKILSNFEAIEDNKIEIVNKIAGKKKTFYLSREVCNKLEVLSDKMLSLRLRANLSDVISIALNKLETCKDKDLLEISQSYLNSKK